MENNIEKFIEPIKLDTTEDRIKVANQNNSALSIEQFKANLDAWAAKFTPEYLEQLSIKCYEDDRKYPENFSNWYYHIKDFGYFKSVDIISNQVFTFNETELMRETDNIKDVDWNKWYEILKPTLEKMKPHKVYNIKNGCFSNKFEFETSLTTKIDLPKNLWKINYRSAELETGGYTELVVREAIPYMPMETPTIYNGMPLREELRVFYNMDTHSIEYIEDYWNYDYCEPYLCNITDKIIFNWFHNKIGNRKIQHKELLEELKQRIYDNIYTLKFDNELKGIWSIDFMYVADYSEYSGLWLVDMARGYRSAYWDTDKLNSNTREQLLKEYENGN